MSRVLSLYQKLERYPLGRYIFSKLICLKAPYFGTVKPVFRELKQGSCSITMKKRRSIQNHLKSVHAIAMCNISELAAGTMVEATLSPEYRWIPRSMTVEYKKIARTDLAARTTVKPEKLNKEQDIGIPVSVKDVQGEEVFSAVITMYISKRK